MELGYIRGNYKGLSGCALWIESKPGKVCGSTLLSFISKCNAIWPSQVIVLCSDGVEAS